MLTSLSSHQCAFLCLFICSQAVNCTLERHKSRTFCKQNIIVCFAMCGIELCAMHQVVWSSVWPNGPRILYTNIVSPCYHSGTSGEVLICQKPPSLWICVSLWGVLPPIDWQSAPGPRQLLFTTSHIQALKETRWYISVLSFCDEFAKGVFKWARVTHWRLNHAFQGTHGRCREQHLNLTGHECFWPCINTAWSMGQLCYSIGLFYTLKYTLALVLWVPAGLTFA